MENAACDKTCVRMKGGQGEHRVPLTGRCIELLRRLNCWPPAASGLRSFPGEPQEEKKPRSNMVLALNHATRLASGTTGNGFRIGSFGTGPENAPICSRNPAEASTSQIVKDIDRGSPTAGGDFLTEKVRNLMSTWTTS